MNTDSRTQNTDELDREEPDVTSVTNAFALVPNASQADDEQKQTLAEFSGHQQEYTSASLVPEETQAVGDSTYQTSFGILQSQKEPSTRSELSVPRMPISEFDAGLPTAGLDPSSPIVTDHNERTECTLVPGMTESKANVRSHATNPIIALSNVSVQYPNGVSALNNVDLIISQGDFVFLVGPTGAGKSTILKLLYMDGRATAGRVWVNGRDLSGTPAAEVPYVRRKMGIILQDFGLLPRRTVWENVAFACHVIGQSPKETRKRIPNVLERVGMLHRADAYPNELSGGEQQRVAIARALVNNPPLLIADEPTGSLDPKTGNEIMDLLLATAASGTTVVVATHDKTAVDRLQQRVIALSGGRIVRDDSVGLYGDSEGLIG